MNKIVLEKNISAIFLGIVLVAGTFALSSPSFMIADAQATSDREKDYDDNDDKKKSYDKDNDRDNKSRDHDKYDDDKKSYVKYNDESSDEEKDYDDLKKSYGKEREKNDKSRDHTDDKTRYDYESTKSPDYSNNRYNNYEPYYGMDNDYKDRYGKDSYESQYSSYGKDNNSYKSKEDSSSSSVSIKKIKCNNINVNVNGLELTTLPPGLTGILSDGEGAGDEGKYGATSYGSDETGYGSSGQSVNDNSFKFVCINNNNNTVIAEEPEPDPEPLTCEECFTTNLNETQFNDLLDSIAVVPNFSFEELCEQLSNATLTNEVKLIGLFFIFYGTEQISEETFIRILECLEELELITLPPDFDDIPPPPPPI